MAGERTDLIPGVTLATGADDAEEQKRRDRGDYLDDEGAGTGDDEGAEPGKKADDGDQAGAASADKGGEGGAESGGDEDVDTDLDAETLRAVAGSDPNKRVPLSRLAEVAHQRDSERDRALRLEGENKALREKLGQAKPAEGDEGGAEADPDANLTIKQLRRKATEATLEGDAELAEKYNEMADAKLLVQARTEAVQETTQREQQREFSTAVTDVVTKYPFLNSKSKDANATAIAEVVEWRDFYITKGHSQADALRKAAERVAEPIAKAAEGGDDKGDDKGGKPKPAQDRQAQAIARNANAATRQPATPAPVGKGARGLPDGSLGKDVAQMTDEEWSRLPADEKKKMRGDYLEA